MPKTPKIYINGINGETGRYLVEPKTIEQLMPFITGEEDSSILGWVRYLFQRLTQPHYGAGEPDWSNPAEAGWGLVFHQAESQAVRLALEPLYQRRRQQIGSDALVRKLEYQPGEDWKEFLGRYGIAPGSKDPAMVPYYLLLVGSPQAIPFEFGHKLDVEYAVGRLDFPDAAGYTAYVASLLAYENPASQPQNARRAVFFGTRHPFDPATILSADQLITPLADGQAGKPGAAQEHGFAAQKIIEKAATRLALNQVFSPPAGEKPPALVFTATHGIGWPKEKPAEQAARQGALLCQDWPGFGKMAPEHYFSAADLPASARLSGQIAFIFACYGAGTPASDRFFHKPGVKPPPIAEKPFTAALPRAMLAHPTGGSLAVIGHVERAWGYSITTTEAGAQIGPLRNTVERLLLGLPVGHAVRDLNQRYATLSVNLADLMEKRTYGEKVNDDDLANSWIERNDSEGYIVLGDPAVRLRVDELT